MAVIERGVVTRAGDGTVDVRMASSAACSSCSSCCHVGRDGVTVEGAIDRLGASVGDRIEIEVPEGADTRAGILVFVLPAAGLLAGYWIGYVMARAAGLSGDLGGAAGAVAAIVLALMLLRKRGRDALSSAEYRPRVRAIIAPAQSAAPSSGADSDGPTGPSSGPHG